MLYQQETELQLLLALFQQLDHKTVIDAGAELGSFSQAFLDAGATSVIAIEPYPPNVTALHERFDQDGRVEIMELAVGDREGVVPLWIAEYSEGNTSALHSLVQFEDTPTVRRVGETPVTLRTLSSLVEEKRLPAKVGILKIDTEGNDLAVVRGMGGCTSHLIMVEYWDTIPEIYGPCPYRVGDVTDYLQTRGYKNFVVIRRHGEFEVIQINDDTTQPGDWGNVIFIHDDHISTLTPVLFPFMNRVQEKLRQQAAFLAQEAASRQSVIEEQTRAIEAFRQANEALRGLMEVQEQAIQTSEQTLNIQQEQLDAYEKTIQTQSNQIVSLNRTLLNRVRQWVHQFAHRSAY